MMILMMMTMTMTTQTTTTMMVMMMILISVGIEKTSKHAARQGYSIVPTFDSYTKCVGSSRIIHDRMPDSHPVS